MRSVRATGIEWYVPRADLSCFLNVKMHTFFIENFLEDFRLKDLLLRFDLIDLNEGIDVLFRGGEDL